ncbi:MAG TPA: cupin domain-containing protein [Bryobacteraceae bacterium]|nr:cupin domain-containing protein [Bryobacteraceae bacterium]
MRYSITILLIACWPVCGQLRDVTKSEEIDKMFARAQPSLDVLVKPNLTITFRAASGKAVAPQTHTDADEFWFVRRGTAGVALGTEAKRYDVAAGDVVSVPRGTQYQIAPGGTFEFVAVSVFPAKRNLNIGIGATGTPKPMPPVARKADIDATLASADKNVTLHSAGSTLINHVVYKGAPGPHEVHQTCDDLYFMRLGTAQAHIDGRLVDGKEDPTGEIRGTGVTGARTFNIGPGDLVWIPRNTAHFMNPMGPKLGYLLVKVCD